MVVIIGTWDELAVAEASVMLQQPEARCAFSKGSVPRSRHPGSGRLHRPLGWWRGM